MAEEILDTTTTAVTPVVPRSDSKKTKCVFCECVMTVDGQDIYHMGEKAKAFQKQDERLAKKDEEIAKLQADLTEVKRERDALVSGSETSHRHRPGGRVVR